MRRMKRFLAFLSVFVFCLALTPAAARADGEAASAEPGAPAADSAAADAAEQGPGEEPAVDGEKPADEFSTMDELRAGLAAGAVRMTYSGAEPFIFDSDFTVDRYVELVFNDGDVVVAESARLVVLGELYAAGTLHVRGSMHVGADAWVEVGGIESYEGISVEEYGGVCLYAEVRGPADFAAALEKAAEIPSSTPAEVFCGAYVFCPLDFEGDAVIPSHMQVHCQLPPEAEGTDLQITATVRGTLRIEGMLCVYDGCAVRVEGAIENKGEISLLRTDGAYALTVTDGGELINGSELNAWWGKGVEVLAGGRLVNNGSISIYQRPYASTGQVLVAGTMVNNGRIYMNGYGMSTATGRLTIGEGGAYQGEGELRIRELYQDPAKAIVGLELDRFESWIDREAECQVFRLSEPGVGVRVALNEDGTKAFVTGSFADLYARLALMIDNNGESGLFINQVAIDPDGEIAVPEFQLPGLTVLGVSIALVRTPDDIVSPRPNTVAWDFKFFR